MLHSVRYTIERRLLIRVPVQDSQCNLFELIGQILPRIPNLSMTFVIGELDDCASQYVRIFLSTKTRFPNTSERKAGVYMCHTFCYA